jgi:tRNA G10  N-methylase Trm11
LTNNIDEQYDDNTTMNEAMELMDKMIEKELKVDCIITDPPYNISKDNNFNNFTILNLFIFIIFVLN